MNCSALAQLETVVFDCDGVLLDSEYAAQRIEKQVLRELGGTCSDADFQARYSGHPSRLIFQTAAAEQGVAIDEVTLQAMVALVAAATVTAPPIPGIHAALSRVACRKAVVSNSDRSELTNKLGRNALDRFFAPFIFSKDDVFRSKPAPDLYLAALAATGTPAHKALAVEDSFVGIQAARAAGLHVIGFVGGRHNTVASRDHLLSAGCFAVVESAEELADFLDGHEAMAFGAPEIEK